MTTTTRSPKRSSRNTRTTRSPNRSARSTTTRNPRVDGRRGSPPASKRLGQVRTRRAKTQRRQPVTANGERLATLIVLVVLGLTLFGLVMVLSASSVTSVHEQDASPFFMFQRQALWALLGGIGFLVASRIDYRRLQPLATPILLLTIFVLVLVLIPGIGRSVNGSRRWIGLGPIGVQPSEFAKLALVIFVADLLRRRETKMHISALTVRPVCIVLGFLSLLIVLQPKLGTPIVLCATGMVLLFVAGVRVRSLLPWAAFGMIAVTALAFSEDYRKRRLTAFMDPWSDPLGTGMQTIQSQVGIASGGLTGVGLGASRSKWGFLPYAHSDFIFAIVAEEVGLIGAAALIAAFLLLGYLGTRVALGAPDRFGMLLATGITAWLLIQAFVNIGMAMGQLPITGEPLPFVSAGGSSLMVSLAAAGLLTNIARRARQT